MMIPLISSQEMAFATNSVPYHFRSGDHWTYESSEGITENIFVEGHGQANLKKGVVYFATLRRSNGSDRVVVRDENSWIECSLVKARNNEFRCVDEVKFMVWPIETGDRWSARDFDFYVESYSPEGVVESLERPYWKILYLMKGSNVSIGEAFVSPGVGRTYVVEDGATYVLKKFQEGHGEPLLVSKKELLEAFFVREEIALPTQETSPTRISLFSWSSPFTVVLMLVLFVMVLGVGLLQALRGREKMEALPPPQNPDEEMKLIAAIARGGDLQPARDKLLQLIEENPTYPDLRHQLALIYRSEGRLEEAKQEWLIALERKPNYTDARLALGNLFLSLGLGDEAIEQFSAVVQIHPTYADAQLGLGRAYLACKDYAAAHAAIERALHINPDYELAQKLLKECLEASQRDTLDESSGS